MFRIFEIFKSQHIVEFASGLAADLNRRFPPSSEQRTDTGAVNQLKVILEGLGVRASRFQELHHLGIYGKAKLANVFQWKLKELGYSEAFIGNATKLIVARISARKTEPAK
jgi:hypothetical protein